LGDLPAPERTVERVESRRGPGKELLYRLGVRGRVCFERFDEGGCWAVEASVVSPNFDEIVAPNDRSGPSGRNKSRIASAFWSTNVVRTLIPSSSVKPPSSTGASITSFAHSLSSRGTARAMQYSSLMISGANRASFATPNTKLSAFVTSA